MDPEFVDAWNNKGTALYILKKYKEALTCYNKVIEISPQDKFNWIKKGLTLCELGEYDPALSCYDKALELGAKSSDIERLKKECYDMIKKN